MSNDWIEHNGGPQPVGGDVEVEVLYRRMVSPCKQVGAARFRIWKHRPEKPDRDIMGYRILNQHLIDAARKDGFEAGLEKSVEVANFEGRQNIPRDDQNLIDAARLEGIRLGLEAAANETERMASLYSYGPERAVCHKASDQILNFLNPETIAREAVLDQLTSEAQAQGVGYAQEADQ